MKRAPPSVQADVGDVLRVLAEEDEVAGLQRGAVDRGSRRVLELQVGVAGKDDAVRVVDRLTKPLQSRPWAVIPPQRYGTPRKRRAVATRSSGAPRRGGACGSTGFTSPALHVARRPVREAQDEPPLARAVGRDLEARRERREDERPGGRHVGVAVDVRHQARDLDDAAGARVARGSRRPGRGRSPRRAASPRSVRGAHADERPPHLEDVDRLAEHRLAHDVGCLVRAGVHVLDGDHDDGLAGRGRGGAGARGGRGRGRRRGRSGRGGRRPGGDEAHGRDSTRATRSGGPRSGRGWPPCAPGTSRRRRRPRPRTRRPPRSTPR